MELCALKFRYFEEKNVKTKDGVSCVYREPESDSLVALFGFPVPKFFDGFSTVIPSHFLESKMAREGGKG